MNEDHIFLVVVGTLALVAGAIVIDALTLSFDLPNGFWGVCSAVLAVAGGRAVFGGRKD